MYYLFHNPDKRADPEYIKRFKTRLNARQYIKRETARLLKEYPKEKWSEDDYLIAWGKK